MSLPIPSLSELDPVDVAARLSLITAAVADFAPECDRRRGVLHDVVLSLHAVLDTAQQQALADALSATSLAAILEDPTLATEEAVDALVSNYQVTRRAATTASGTATLVVTSLTPVVVAAGTTFTAGSVELSCSTTITARTSSALVTSDSDRLLRSLGDGTYAFSVDVEAASPGAAGNVTTGTDLVMLPALSNLSRAFADGMSGGADAESNADLLNRLLAGAAVQSYGSRQSVEGVLRTALPSTVAVSSVGAGDAEQLRDRHGLFPVSAGGKVDVFLRSAALYQKLVLSVSATLISAVGSVGTWQLGLGRDDAPGFYEVEKVLLPDAVVTATGFAVTQDTRGVDLSTGYAPDVLSGLEATYSPFQTAVIRFQDTITDASALSPGDEADYQIVVRVLPDLRTAQDLLADREHLPVGGDVLVRAAVPCFVRAGFNLLLSSSAALPDLTAVRVACAAAVNATGFSDRLSASVLTQAAQSLVPAAQISAVSLSGRLRPVDGSAVLLTGTDALSLSADPEIAVGALTVCFFLDPADLTVNVVRV